MADNKAHAKYLVNPDTGKVELVHADEIAERTADNQKTGWKEPTSLRPNGEPWNAPEDAVARDAAAEAARTSAAAKAKLDAEKADEHEASRLAAEEAIAAAAETPDLKVQIVEPAKPAKKVVAKKAAKKSSKRR